MSDIQYKFYIDKLYVRQYDGAPNAVSRVYWICEMKRNGAMIYGSGQTDLNQPNVDSFINIAELEAQKVIDWVLQELGGQDWVTWFISAHEGQMQEAEKAIGLEAWHIPLVNPLKFEGMNA